MEFFKKPDTFEKVQISKPGKKKTYETNQQNTELLFYSRLIGVMGEKTKSGGTKKVPTFSKTKKMGNLKKKMREVGILRKIYFFP